MDERFLRYYNLELQHVREHAAEFARDFPKIAGRLGLEGFECADPYVERLLEGFAFLAARVQLKLDAEFPRFTRHLLEIVYPHYLAPIPSMAIVEVQPDLKAATLASGVVLPRQTALRSQLGKGDQTACEFRTAHDVTLWPIQLAEAEYLAHLRDLPTLPADVLGRLKAGLRIVLRTSDGIPFKKLAIDRLPIFLRGGQSLPYRLYEQLLGNTIAVVARTPGRGGRVLAQLAGDSVKRAGFAEEQALLPVGARSFQGYRLLHEYFSFPERFLFVELTELRRAIEACDGGELELILLFDRNHDDLHRAISAENLALFCSPAINVFPRRADRVPLDRGAAEYHLVVDRTRPLDFEVYQVGRVVGHGTSAEGEREFLPFYRSTDFNRASEGVAYFTLDRFRRGLTAKERQRGSRSNYLGSEVAISLVDSEQAPVNPSLRELSVDVLASNRDLPLHMPVGVGRTDFSLEVAAPVESVRCVAGPTEPFPSHAEGSTAWRLVGHLSLNYLSITDLDESKGAAALRDMLALYDELRGVARRRQIDGIRSVSSEAVIRRLPTDGPVTFGRGLEIALTVDESAFEGRGAFLFGAVMEEFFARYAWINSFTETVLRTTERGEVMRWPARLGRRSGM